MGGIFGSGLYPKQPAQDTAGNVIDALTRGATTLIHGAYARADGKRQQAAQDAELAIRQKAEQRQESHDQWERTRVEKDDERKTRAEERADFEAGYTPKRIETKDVVEPGSVETNGLFGAQGRVTAPRVKQETATIASAYDFTKSKTAKTKELEVRAEGTRHARDVQDSRGTHRANRDYDVTHPLPSRDGSGTGGGADAVHASAAVRAQIAQANAAIKILETQKSKLAPGTIKGDDERAAVLDEQMKPLIARRDSLSGVNDQIAGKLSSKAGVGGPATIQGAYAPGAKVNGSTIRGGGEAAQPSPTKKDGSTVRSLGKPKVKQPITAAEAKALKARGFKDEQIAAKYDVK